MPILCRDGRTFDGSAAGLEAALGSVGIGLNQKMARLVSKNGNGARTNQASKYDANNTVLSKTYGALADLRRELSDSKSAVAEREELLHTFRDLRRFAARVAVAGGLFREAFPFPQRFSYNGLVAAVAAAQGKTRLEELAFLFLRARRSLPTELSAYANLDRFAQVEEAEQEQQARAANLEHWLFPPNPAHLDSPRATLRVICQPQPDAEQPVAPSPGASIPSVASAHRRKGRARLQEIIELTTRAAHEQELFPPQRLGIHPMAGRRLTPTVQDGVTTLSCLSDAGFDALARRAGDTRPGWRSTADGPEAASISRTNRRTDAAPGKRRPGTFFHASADVPDGQAHPLDGSPVLYRPAAAGAGRQYILSAAQRAAAASCSNIGANMPAVPVRKLSHRLLTHLRKTQSSQWRGLGATCASRTRPSRNSFSNCSMTPFGCVCSPKSQRDDSIWLWNGHEWHLHEPRKRAHRQAGNSR